MPTAALQQFSLFGAVLLGIGIAFLINYYVGKKLLAKEIDALVKAYVSSAGYQEKGRAALHIPSTDTLPTLVCREFSSHCNYSPCFGDDLWHDEYYQQCARHHADARSKANILSMG